MKVYALMWYGVEEQACYGVVSNRKQAKEWKARSNDNDVVEFTLDHMPKIERWRDDKMFPHAPRTGPATNIAEQIEDFYAHTMASHLFENFAFSNLVKR